ncbi:MAG: threonine--tRNA ligase [Polyangiales bacterium]
MSAPSDNCSPMTGAAWLQARGDLDRDVVAVHVDGTLFDLHTPLPAGASAVEPVRARDAVALAVIRHSSAHVLADAVQRLFPGTQVTFGPATDSGFYYDFDRPAGAFSEEELRIIESKMAEIIAEDLPFRREVLSKEAARALLESLGERYKLEHLERLEDPISIYRHGAWVDLCKGPHVPSTRFLQAFKLTSVSGAYWRGDERNPMLQRIYGTAFADAKTLRSHLKRLEEAKERDHRKLSRSLELVAFHPWAPASPFFLPKGATLYQNLLSYVRALYRRDGYEEVITPQIFDRALFERSGHLPEYRDNIYFATTADEPERTSEDARFGIKPMNCPAHALLFGMRRRSYRELPWRVADFGRLHRYERSGVVQGLTRVRTFAQDDGHIFCTEAQMQAEIQRFIRLVYDVYQDFAFAKVRIVVATRPEGRLGSEAVWDASEAALLQAVEAQQLQAEVADGEGAFYGPKIEFHLEDALGRPWQLGTIQVDFVMPERFDLSYVGDDNATHRPVMLHRAILGSVERFLALLIEHCGGAFPVWIAPEQITILSVSERAAAYATQLYARLHDAGIRVRSDCSADKLGAKIRNARLSRVPYIAVVGEREAENDTVSLRCRDDGHEEKGLPMQALLQRLVDESKPPSARKVPTTAQ